MSAAADQARRPVRIGNCSGFYGDRASAMADMASAGGIDVLTGDYLAEVTMLILGKARAKDPTKGYAASFLHHLDAALEHLVANRIRLVVNAGGLNPGGLATATRELAARRGHELRVAHIDGDDVFDRLDALPPAGHALRHLTSGEPLSSWPHRPLTANAYLGGFGIARALEHGADIVITGRVADASLVVGAAAWWWGWTAHDHDALAGAVCAGHVIECGAQATGGNFSGFRDVADLDDPGFPIAEIAADGSSVITKHAGTGGAVTEDTVKAQLLYEIGEPAYLNPDVVAHLDTAEVTDLGDDRVEIRGVRGSAPPPTTKVAITAVGGWQNSMLLALTGPDVDAKAALVERSVRRYAASVEGIDAIAVQRIGRAQNDPDTQNAGTELLRIAVQGTEAAAGRTFSSHLVERRPLQLPRALCPRPPAARVGVRRLLAGAARPDSARPHRPSPRRHHRGDRDDARGPHREHSAAAGDADGPAGVDRRARRGRVERDRAHPLGRQGRRRQRRRLGPRPPRVAMARVDLDRRRAPATPPRDARATCRALRAPQPRRRQLRDPRAPGRRRHVQLAARRAGQSARRMAARPHHQGSTRAHRAASLRRRTVNTTNLLDRDDPPILGANPLVGLTRTQVAAALARLARHVAVDPALVLASGLRAGADLADVTIGRSSVQPAKGDKRFAHPAWAHNPIYRRLVQAYLVDAAAVMRLVDEVDLDPKSRERSRFALTLLVEALAPTNTLAGNPSALAKAVETRGRSLLTGLRHLAGDIRRNGGMPSTVDTRPFRLGDNIATTAGHVVHRTDVFELIQYEAQTETVAARPLVAIPPQINKYYITDLAPDRSLVEHMVRAGFPYFAMSWRNPTAAHRDWNLDTYVAACKEAIEVACEITGADGADVAGICAGGITMGSLLGHLAATGNDLVTSATFMVAGLDTSVESATSMLASKAAVEAARSRTQRTGYLDGADMARVFAWLRPNDLVWNYWVNNYLLGQNPPPFDILFWNADTTRLPAGLHSDFLDLFTSNGLAEATMTVLGTPADLQAVDIDTYVVAGSTDHIVPWRAAYRTTQLTGGETDFVLSSSGHIQAMVNPPGNPKSSYRTTNGTPPADPDEWLATTDEHRGTWWDHWVAWLQKRSSGERPAPTTCGSATHPPLEPAPGRYVHLA